jgi:circadian clock protein KaiC
VGSTRFCPKEYRAANVILLEGAIGCGKTTMGVEFIYRGIMQFDKPGVIVLFEVAPDMIVRDAQGFGWDLHELERTNRLRIVFTSREVLRQELQQADSVLLEEAARIGARRIFIDGVARLIGSNGTPEARSAFHVFTEGLHRENLTAALAIEASLYFPEQSATLPEESIADTVIRLRMEENLRAVSRSLEIVKSRGHSYQMGRHTFRITDGHGIQAYHRVQAPRRASRDRAAAYDSTTRISTGVPGLDKLTNGGFFVGSTTVVAGISGVGKSVMGLQYVSEGAQRNERSLMLNLDEQVDQILRNVVEEFKPKHVVIDSLSTYGSSLGTQGRVFRDFFHALVALMKEHQIAAVYNHENPEMLGMTSMMGDF